MVWVLDLEFGFFFFGVLSFSMGLRFCLDLGFGFDSRRWVFGGDLWLLWLVVWVIIVVVGGGFSLWV